MPSRLLTNIKLESLKLARKIARPLLPEAIVEEFPADFADSTRALIKAAGPYTMTSKERIACIEHSLKYIVAARIPGAIVECGVAAGGSMMAAALALATLDATDRALYLYDTFAGMSEPTDADVGINGKSAVPTYRRRLVNGVSTWINHSVEEVRANLTRTGYPPQQLHFVVGKVEETLPHTCPEQIAFLRLDTDWYESTRAEMQHLFPRLSPGGVLLLDDYNRWLGSRRAVDEYLAEHGINMFLARIDDHAVVAVKPR